jgi:Family of unknown function (DUF6400)
LPTLTIAGNAIAMRDLDFSYDLTLDEARRRAAVLEAIGDDWDPIAVLAEEEKAYDLLYSDLDEEQQRMYDELVSAGVLPDRTTAWSARRWPAGVRRTRRPSGSISWEPVSLARAAICCDTVDVVRWCVSATARIEPSRESDSSNCRRRVST